MYAWLCAYEIFVVGPQAAKRVEREATAKVLAQWRPTQSGPNPNSNADRLLSGFRWSLRQIAACDGLTKHSTPKSRKVFYRDVHIIMRIYML